MSLNKMIIEFIHWFGKPTSLARYSVGESPPFSSSASHVSIGPFRGSSTSASRSSVCYGTESGAGMGFLKLIWPSFIVIGFYFFTVTF